MTSSLTALIGEGGRGACIWGGDGVNDCDDGCFVGLELEDWFLCRATENEELIILVVGNLEIMFIPCCHNMLLAIYQSGYFC
jgi:hypothetical protein